MSRIVFQPVHSRHEDIEKQQVEIAGFEGRQPLTAVAGGDHAVAGPFQQNPDGGLDGAIVVHDQDLRHSLDSRKQGSMFGCEAVAAAAQAIS